jgi:hypothetical protein
MKALGVVLIGGMLAACLPCAAELACEEVAVQARVEAVRGELTLADLLASKTCPPLRHAAEQVSLGSAPRTGSVRVIDGGQIRRLLEEVAGAKGLSRGETVAMQIPERIVVRRAGARKSCAQIATFLVSKALPGEAKGSPVSWQPHLDCNTTRAIPEDTPLELVKTRWNTALRRWEFELRCSRSEDCVPFLVWDRAERTLGARTASGQSEAAPRLTSAAAFSRKLSGAGASDTERLVMPGQTATLTWEHAGIRVVLPVTCLDAGGFGQFVRIRFKNAGRILRAQVVAKGTLRASS